ncbi:MAG: S41 family peptidase [Rhizomicrobium sp.]
MATALPFPSRADQCRDGADNARDIDWLIAQMAARYTYLPDRHVDIDKLRRLYVGEAGAVCEPHAFLNVLERCLAEFHDDHVEAKVNNAHSPQLVPSGTDLWASVRDGKAVIEQVRPQSESARAGLRAGDEIVSIGGVAVTEAIAANAPRCLAAADPEADDYTLRVVLAGTHDARRRFVVRNGTERNIDLPSFVRPRSDTPLTQRTIGTIGYIRIENSLGDGALVAAFDAALAALSAAKALILDLRNTPSGGNTDVAEPILGRFISAPSGYQRVFDPRPGKVAPAGSWVRKVAPRGTTVTQPLAVLVDRWTGSMGEGMAIGFDGMTRATIVGTRMAGLCGATSDVTLPRSGIGIAFPTERLYHLDGTPRETWSPPVFVDPRAPGGDAILARAIEILRQ